MKFKFLETSLSDIQTVSEWHKKESVRKWIYIDNWFDYFKAVKDAPDYYLYSVYQDDIMLAHIAGEVIDGWLAMDIIVDPMKHGQGFGTAILLDMFAHTSELFGNIHGYIANIYPNNIESKKCFEKAGFRYEKDGVDGEMVYKREYLVADVIQHYDTLLEENNDPIHDPEPLREYMDKWDGQAFIDELQLSKDKSVLEIGVGTGRLAIKVAPECGSFTGIDISPKTIERARENISDMQNITLICNDFMTHRFDGLFDVIYSSLTFMHISDKLTAINKVAELLAPGGRFVLSIDKNPSDCIDMNNRILMIFPDNPDDICGYFKAARMRLEKQFETEFAYIFVTGLPVKES